MALYDYHECTSLCEDRYSVGGSGRQRPNTRYPNIFRLTDARVPAASPQNTISLAAVYSIYNKFIFIPCVGHFNFQASSKSSCIWCLTSRLSTGWGFGEVRASLNSNCQLSYCCLWLIQMSRGWVEGVRQCVRVPKCN